MSIYGHTHINVESLKRWVNSLNVKSVKNIKWAGASTELEDKIREILEAQLSMFSCGINNMSDGDDWRKFQGMLSNAFYDIFVKVDNSSIRMGDFYECLIEPSNVKTYKKIIKGFDYIDVGDIHIRNTEGYPVASIGAKSDLIWNVFYNYFINEDENSGINHAYANHERILSIQLFNSEELTIEQLKSRVNEILLYISMSYDMDFRVFKLEEDITKEGECSIINVEYTPTEFEEIPMFYLSNAINSSDERLQFLSYYQVIEYFFVRAQNDFFLNELKKIDQNNVNHNELRKVLRDYKKISSEKEALKLVLTNSIDVTNFKIWLESMDEYSDVYCNSTTYNIDASKNEKKVINALVERIYAYRCSIAHAKGDVEEYIAVPMLSNETIAMEIPLIKYLAFEVIKKCSE